MWTALALSELCSVVLTAAAAAWLYRRTGHGHGWTALAVMPAAIAMTGLGLIHQGYVSAEELGVVIAAAFIVPPSMLVALAAKRWPRAQRR